MNVIKPEAAPYLDAFRARSEPDWLAAHREAALARFGERGFPSRREEAWRFNNLRLLGRDVFPPVAGDAKADPELIGRYRLPGATHRLVFVNGRFSEKHSEIGQLPKGAWLGSTAKALNERPELVERSLDDSDLAGGQPFASFNAAFFEDGFILALDAGVELAQRVEIIHLAEASAPASLHLRNAVLLAPNSRATLVETYIGRGPYWTNGVTALYLDRDAALTHVKIQDEGSEAVHFAVNRTNIGHGAQYRNFGLTLGARLSRQDVAAFLNERADCSVNGAYLLRGEQEATNAILIDHAGPNGTTRELFKGVLDERAHGVFLGRIGVRPDAQKTNAQQMNRNLLLSPGAAIDTKPELDILADDVKCSHGAAVGDLDKDTMFYLRARGIGLDEARRLLIEAFVLEAVETVEEPALRDHLALQVRRWLGAEEG